MFFPFGLLVLKYLGADNYLTLTGLLSFSFVISSLIVFIILRLACSFTVNLRCLKIFAYILLAINIVFAFQSVSLLRKAIETPEALATLCFCGIFLVFSNIIFALFAYPVDYGVDLFFYYTGADTIMHKKTLCFLADMPEGKLYTDYSILCYMVLLYNVTAGRNCRSITSFYLPAAALTTVLVGEIISSLCHAPLMQISIAVAIIFALMPSNFESLVKTSHTSGTGFGTILLWTAIINIDKNPSVYIILLSSAFLFLFIIRPESKMFCAILAGVFGFAWILKSFTGFYLEPGTFSIIVTAIFISAVVFFMIFPKIVEFVYQKLPASTKTFSFHYWQYYEHNKKFATLNQHWAFICIHYALVTLGLKEDREKYTMINTMHQIFKHPVTFAVFYFKQVLYLFEGMFFLFSHLSIFSPGKSLHRGLIGLAFFLFSLKIATEYGMSSFLLLFSAGIMFFILPIINTAASSRHLYMIFPMVFPLLISELYNEGLLIAPVVYALITVFIFIDLFIVVKDLFLAKQAVRYASCIDTLKIIIPPDAVLACSFPHVFSYMINRKALGTFYMLLALPGIAQKYKPDFILLNNMTLWFAYNTYKRRKLEIDGYRVVAENPDACYVLLQKERVQI